MRNKPRKIKRYSKIYRRRSNVRSKILKTAGFVVIVAAVVFVGYSVAGPFMDFINGRIEPSSSNDSSSIVSVDTDSSSADPSVKNNTLQAVALSLETAKDPTALDVFQTVVSAMRAGIVSMIHAYDPEAIIFSGGPLNMGNQFTEPLLTGIEQELWGKGRTVRFLQAQNPDESVVLGLHYLTLQARKE